MSDEEAEIRSLQAERKKTDGISFKDVSYDTNFYGGAKDTSAYDTSIAVADYDVEEEEDSHIKNYYLDSRKSFLNSFTGPKNIADDLKKTDDDFDPFKDFRKKTIADKEDEYHSRWRKRKLSPTRLDPYNPKAVPVKESEATSYKDAMVDVLLEQERTDILQKIKEKQRTEREEKEAQERRRKEELEEMRKKEKKRKKRGSRTPSPVRPTGWSVEVTKRGAKLETLHLDTEIVYNLGRDANSEIRLDHESCSKKHAKLQFISKKLNLIDLKSTNGTKLNGAEIKPDEYYKLADGDKIQFGCSTREYTVHYVQ